MKYKISKYDPVDDTADFRMDWFLYKEVNSAREAVETVRELESMGYDREVSILVERID